MLPPSMLAIFTVGQLILSAIVVWLMKKMQVFDIKDFKFREMGKVVHLAWVGIMFPIGVFFYKFVQLPENSLAIPNMFYLVVVILHPLIGTGLLEEVLFRGLVFKILLKKMRHSKKGIINACLISSAFFGIVHIFNLFAGNNVLSVVETIISAFAFGMFCSAVFLRTRTLWIPILLHGFTNLSHQIFNAISSPVALYQDSLISADISIPKFILENLVGKILYLIAGIVLLRKVKPGEIADDIVNY
jgi:membrane protease YdiL (CAAX protease family)